MTLSKEQAAGRTNKVQSLGDALMQADMASERAYLPVYRKMREAGITIDSISGGGDDLAAFQAGVMVGWQGAAFFATFKDANGKVEMTGSVLNPDTGRHVQVTKTRADWQRALASKVTKLRKGYATFLDVGDPREDEPKDGKSKNGAGKSGGARLNLIGQVAKECAGWIERIDRVVDGTTKNNNDKKVDADMTSLRKLLQAAHDEAAQLK